MFDDPGAILAKIERRTVLHAAWAAPVVALAVSTPAASASIVPSISIVWSRTPSSYQLTYTNNTGDTLSPGDAEVVVESSLYISNFNYNLGAWLPVDGDGGNLLNNNDLANGESSIVYFSITIVDPHFEAHVLAVGGDYIDNADLNINT